MAGQVLFFGGLFDIVDPFFGIPIYGWFWIFITFFAICTWLAFRYGVWEKYKPLWGLFYAFKAQSKAAFIFNINLVMELWSEAQAKVICDYSKCTYLLEDFDWGLPKNLLSKGISFIILIVLMTVGILVFGLGGFLVGLIIGGILCALPINYEAVLKGLQKFLFYYPLAYLDPSELDWMHAILYKFGHRNMDVEIAKKLEGESDWDQTSATTVGGTDTDQILDAGRWTIRNSIQHKEIEAFRELWNEANPNDRVESYMKFQRMLLDGKSITKETKDKMLPHIEPTVTIPWIRIDSAFPVTIEDNEQAGARRQQAKDDEESSKNLINKYIPLIIGGGLGFAAIIFVVRVIFAFMSAPAK